MFIFSVLHLRLFCAIKDFLTYLLTYLGRCRRLVPYLLERQGCSDDKLRRSLPVPAQQLSCVWRHAQPTGRQCCTVFKYFSYVMNTRWHAYKLYINL